MPALRPIHGSQVFGKTLVCRNLDIAARAARESDLNCVTMDGDQVGWYGRRETTVASSPELHFLPVEPPVPLLHLPLPPAC